MVGWTTRPRSTPTQRSSRSTPRRWEFLWAEIKKDLIEHGYNFDIPRADSAGGSGTSTADRDVIGVEHFDLAPDTALLRQLLAEFPATHEALADRDDWIKFLMSVKTA